MLPILIAGLAAAAVLLIAVGIAMSGGSVALRLASSATRAPAATRPRTADADKDSAVDGRPVAASSSGQDATERLATEIARADLKLRPAEFLVAVDRVSPFVFVAASIILGFVFPGLRNPSRWSSSFVLGLYCPALLPRLPPGEAPEGVQRASCPTRSPCSPTRSAPGRRSSRASSSSPARRGRRSARSSSASSAR